MAGSSFESMFEPAMTFEQIAEKLGVSHQRVHQIYKHAMKKIRRNQALLVEGLLIEIDEGRPSARQYARHTTQKATGVNW